MHNRGKWSGTELFKWDVIQMIENGFAVATVAYGDLAPDVTGEIDRGASA